MSDDERNEAIHEARRRLTLTDAEFERRQKAGALPKGDRVVASRGRFFIARSAADAGIGGRPDVAALFHRSKLETKT